ncbi:prolyl-tRNA synthetase [Backusella circina FSU 941]|nr:prolyl-tRNA synthetase [Backusella circina FSU 941]
MPMTKDKGLSDASKSHSILLKGGFVRQSGAGIYSLLPLGLRTIEKIEHIIDQEMQAIASQKLSLPVLLPTEGWKKTGRWDGAKGEFFRLQDRKQVDLLLAPTHEEEITSLVAGELRSPKQLPIRLYQIGRKYRDELRPRAGLLRGREFIMKDLYSFDATVEDAYKTYEEVAGAYRNIFTRLGVPFVVAEADSGNIGGSKSHEYHLISSVGEDTLLTCSSCGYTANDELAVGTIDTNPQSVMMNSIEDVIKSKEIEYTVLKYSGLDAEEKGQVQGMAAVVVPASRTPNLLKVQTKLSNYLKANKELSERAVLDVEEVPLEKVTSESLASAHLFIDDAVKKNSKLLTTHQHDHYRVAQEGDGCVHCAAHTALTSVKAIECGHTFYLGTKYSSVLDCSYRDTKGQKHAAEMGCYGIGISRLLAAVAEAKHDDRGIAWPRALAPYSICIVPTDDRNDQFKALANQIYDDLGEADAIIDDRRLGFGSKMKDSELIGYPMTVVIGKKALEEEGLVEVHKRIQHSESEKYVVPMKDLKATLTGLF